MYSRIPEMQQPPMAQTSQARPAVDLDDLFGPRVTAPPPTMASPYLAPYQTAPPPQQPPPVMVSTPMPPAETNLPPPPPYEGGVVPSVAAAYGLPYATQTPPLPPNAMPMPATSPYGFPPQTTTGTTVQTSYYNTVPVAAAPVVQQCLPSGSTLPVASSAAPPPPARSQEDEDKEQLEKIIRLRRELELEQEREQQKREELQTWGCAQCTFRNKLSVTRCEMCDAPRPGYAPSSKPAIADPAPRVAPAPVTSTSIVTPPTVPTPTNGTGNWSQWQCSSCSTVNDNTLNRCRACNAFRHTGIPLGGGAGNGVAATPPRTAPAPAPVATPFTCNWRCSICATVNSPAHSNCVTCNGYQRNGTPVTDAVTAGTPAPPTSLAMGGQSVGGVSAVVVRSNGVLLPAPSATWTCSVCTVENPVSVDLCKVCQSGVRPRHLSPQVKPTSHSAHHHRSGQSREDNQQRTWPCPTCTFVNPRSLSKCDMCGAARPAQYAPPPSAGDAERKKREEESDEEEVQWQEDTVVQSCNRCHQNFGLLRRRHHCRACGYVFCATCSAFQIPLKKGGEPQRVCANCFEARQKDGVR